MALSKDKKKEVVETVGELLKSSRLTVYVSYPGTSVKSMQRLRRDSRQGGTRIMVVKNRLFKKALEQNDNFKDVPKDSFKGQLLYAFNAEDEVAPAQALAQFAKTESQLEFVGALSQDGQLLSAEDVKSLASLPSKEQLRAQLVGTLSAPVSGFVNALAGNVRGVLNVLSVRAEKIN